MKSHLNWLYETRFITNSYFIPLVNIKKHHWQKIILTNVKHVISEHKSFRWCGGLPISFSFSRILRQVNHELARLPLSQLSLVDRHVFMDENRQIDDAFITFMLYYMHVVSGVTLILSAVVFYLMLTRTPRSGRALVKHLMVVQVSPLNFIRTNLPESRFS